MDNQRGSLYSRPGGVASITNPNYQETLKKTMSGVFIWMLVGLAVTALASYITVTTPAILTAVFGSPFLLITLIIAELALVVVLSLAINKISSAVATALFILYSLINGITLSCVFLAYDLGTVFMAFAISAVMFGGMAVFGYVTKRDLTTVGSFLIMGLFGVLIAMVVNMFLRSDVMSYVISIVAVLVFVGLTAFDTQRIKNSVAHYRDTESLNKLIIIGALSLYLDFINIFLHMLRLLGRK